ncbi:hypothetical protein PTL465_18930 [Ligilactobacillus agilis]|nr:hypothetical protein PTL465_18930 [Ligilactobacillus agilis]
MDIENMIMMERAYARQDGWDKGHVEGRDEAREEAAKALIEDARQNHKNVADLLATLKVICKDQAYIDKMLAKYYY